MTPQGVIDDMDRLQIDVSVISSATVIEPTYWAEPDLALKLSPTERYRRNLGYPFTQAPHR